MIEKIIQFSIKQRTFVVLAALLLVVAGIAAALRLPIDAIPDITNKQVQINVKAPALGPEDVARQITAPLELALGSLPRRQEIRSLSQFGLSQVTVIFDDDVDIYFARQLVNERVSEARDSLPDGVQIELGPVSTGLGEILHITLEGDKFSPMERRTMMDWVVAPQLRTVPGIAEINTMGGQVKQFQVLVDPQKMVARKITLRQVFDALSRGNQDAGGAYITRGSEQQIVRGSGLVGSLDDIRDIAITAKNGVPVLIRDVASVELGAAVRQGAATLDGKGETVIGVPMLLLGENGRVVVERVKAKIQQIQKTLPPGARLTMLLDRSDLIGRAIGTVTRNLLEGGLLVVFVLFLFLLQVRAGLIVSSAIPLAMLMTLIGMNYFGVSANLMSLGAIDFGLIVDGAVIIVENAVRLLAHRRGELGRELSQEERDTTIQRAAVEVLKPALFGMVIIIAAYIPILTLVGIEGKMFRPMGQAVIMALVAAAVLSLTLIPALCSFFLKVKTETENPVVAKIQRGYGPALRWAMNRRALTVGGALVFLVACLALFPLLGSEFIPELDEGALSLEVTYPPSISLEEVVKRQAVLERVLLESFPDEVETVLSKMGRSELATDPMLQSGGDVMITLKPQANWKRAHSKEELVDQMATVLDDLPGVGASIGQPIKSRMMELVEGVGIKGDIGIKLFGPDPDVRQKLAERIARIARTVRGAVDVKVEVTEGLPLLDIRVRRAAIARYGLSVGDVQDVIETALGGKEASTVVQGERRFPLVVRLASAYRGDPDAIGRITVPAPDGSQLPLAQLTDIRSTEGPVQVSRDNGEGRTLIQANVRGRDLGGVVEELQRKADAQLQVPPGYRLEYGGTYQKLQSGRARLMIVVPVTFAVIFLLLFTTFGSLKQAALIFTGIPFAITGGILALWGRGMHFSISAGIGFIALFGVAVLNGVVLVTFINELREEGVGLREAVERGCLTRLRPVLMTATVASIGFIPMALGHGAGAEVQKPLATVVIGGLLTSTLLTLFVLPTLYNWLEKDERREVEV
ncbi:cobalt-zinc-cadmium resistance protein CzcA [Abditibacterium utsteinense]|uniref:Cobalt-zinc-cadmium resistance protein CzcA n=1 Tax=Abditibacterium utsteinense TaxID=1960156 RepID=A0A2S8SPU5_9BACT|nr:CusA/CzcA family heavy metal efflux RND transporter [Abditibacterium utsteinense]PQV62804.1 cobalt-zinc-cadmium resistance protein CzcA [Abditibacterium utsteinense]